MYTRDYLFFFTLIVLFSLAVVGCKKKDASFKSAQRSPETKKEVQSPSDNYSGQSQNTKSERDMAESKPAPRKDMGNSPQDGRKSPRPSYKRRLNKLSQKKGKSRSGLHTLGGQAPRQSSLRREKKVEKFNREGYDHIEENDFLSSKANPLSTFSIDVDTASYSNIRRFINRGQLPPKGAVRIEEMINYFNYDYKAPKEDPFSVNVEIAGCPWNLDNRLVRIGLKGKEIASDKRPASNIVFLLDVSGSMRSRNKLPLLKKGLKMLVDNLSERDRVAIVVYAGASGLVLPSTSCDNKQKILSSLRKLRAGGSTNAGSGIQLAYKVAEKNFIKGGTNRVILATDGDFNVGRTSRSDMIELIEEKAKSGVFLTVLGLGMGNYRGGMLENLSNKGNGNYAYIDNEKEAKKVLVQEMGGTLVTIAKDVKIQVEFNPLKVKEYRLIGYENRKMKAKDFDDDTKDAGEIGAGHTVTALYEIVPRKAQDKDGEKKLRYSEERKASETARTSGETLLLKLRYKRPEGKKSRLLKFPIKDTGEKFDTASANFKFAAAVASFGMILRDSKHKGNANFGLILEMAREGQGPDKNGHRQEFTELVQKAKKLKARQ